jgi:hypothetical protein
MLNLAVTLLIMALIAAVLGFGGIAVVSVQGKDRVLCRNPNCSSSRRCSVRSEEEGRWSNAGSGRTKALDQFDDLKGCGDGTARRLLRFLTGMISSSKNWRMPI